MRRVLPVTLILIALSMSGLAVHADVVRLSGERTVRVVAVSTTEDQATLVLLSGGTMTVPRSSILLVEVEPFSPEICAASPYRCQDRAMLTRMMRAAAIASAQAADNAHQPVSPPGR